MESVYHLSNIFSSSQLDLEVSRSTSKLSFHILHKTVNGCVHAWMLRGKWWEIKHENNNTDHPDFGCGWHLAMWLKHPAVVREKLLEAQAHGEDEQEPQHGAEEHRWEQDLTLGAHRLARGRQRKGTVRQDTWIWTDGKRKNNCLFFIHYYNEKLS